MIDCSPSFFKFISFLFSIKYSMMQLKKHRYELLFNSSKVSERISFIKSRTLVISDASRILSLIILDRILIFKFFIVTESDDVVTFLIFASSTVSQGN